MGKFDYSVCGLVLAAVMSRLLEFDFIYNEQKN